MIQLYFLSILCNGLCGYLLFSGDEQQDIEKTRISLNNPTVILVLGILGAVTGVLKLLSPFENEYYFVGDLFPALAGILAGFILIFGMYRQDTYAMTASHKSLDNIAAILLKYRKPIGLGIFAVAVLHFLFPKAFFL